MDLLQRQSIALAWRIINTSSSGHHAFNASDITLFVLFSGLLSVAFLIACVVHAFPIDYDGPGWTADVGYEETELESHGLAIEIEHLPSGSTPPIPSHRYDGFDLEQDVGEQSSLLVQQSRERSRERAGDEILIVDDEEESFDDW
jgi:hypothetical protein